MFAALKKKIADIVLDHRFLLALYLLAAVGAAIQLLALGSAPFVMQKEIPGDIMLQHNLMVQFIGKQTTNYNNYLIFKYSFYHLLHGANLYELYPDEHWDFFKYSPSFALLMAPLAWLPDYLGLPLWNVLNAAAVFIGVRMLPFGDRAKSFILLFIFLELLTSLQNTQSNGLLCGLIIVAYGFMERGKIGWAALMLVLVTFIKVYGAIGFCLFLFFPQKGRAALYTLMWTALLLLAPLLVTSADKLMWQYHNWKALLMADRAASLGISVMAWLTTWFHYTGSKALVTLAGVVLFLLQLTRVKLYQQQAYRELMLASMLIWVIIFNHKAESPTYVIAVAGVAIWYFSRAATIWRTLLLWTVLVFTCLSATDLFPPVVKNSFLIPYTIKAVPCIMVWCVIWVEGLILLKAKAESGTGGAASESSVGPQP